MRCIRFALYAMLSLTFATACSDGDGSPFDVGGSGPILSGSEVILDFEEFSGGDTITSTQAVAVSLPKRGRRCADAVIAFDTTVPHGFGDDDLDLGTPNETFGGPGVGEGGEAGQPYQNDKSLGNVLVIQEDPAHPDGNPDPQDDCMDGGTVAFDFSALAPGGVSVTAITVMDLDDETLANGTVIRLFNRDNMLLKSVHPPATGQNGVASVDLGPTSGVVRLEMEQLKSVPIARIFLVVPDRTT